MKPFKDPLKESRKYTEGLGRNSAPFCPASGSGPPFADSGHFVSDKQGFRV